MTHIEKHLSLFRCPISGEELRVAAADELAAINEEMSDGSRLSRDGSRVPESLQTALVAADGQFVYRLADGVACLLPDLAIVRAHDVVSEVRDADSAGVRRFYDELGWVQRADGTYEDTALFTEVSPIAERYRVACNRRIGRQLRGGKYLLDVASGAIPHPEYLDFSANYDFRVCVDFSMLALLEAAKKLGEKAICVLGDITCLPLRSDAVDDAISLHTIYHVPVDRQTAAVDELVRVTKRGGSAIVVYTWSRSSAMETVFKVRGALGTLRRGGRPSPAAVKAKTAPASDSPLYFHPQGIEWYHEYIRPRHPARLLVWSLVSTFYQHRFFRSRLTGNLAAKIVECIETMAPSWCGRHGQYPMFVIRK